MFSAALNHRSTAQTCTPNSCRKKIDDDARPQPRSSTLIPGRRSRAVASHSANHSELAPPLALAITQSEWYFAERGNRSETRRLSDVKQAFPFPIRPTWGTVLPPSLLLDAQFSLPIEYKCESVR